MDRALQILELFSMVQPELTVSEVARALDVERSIASRLLAALQLRRFVTQDESTGRFRVGVRGLDLGALYLHGHRLVAAAAPYLEWVVTQHAPEARSNLFVLEDGEALRLASYPARPMLGLRVPAHCTAAGKVLLAALPEAELERVIATRGLRARTPRTLTDPAALREHLASVRVQGYALEIQENGPHTRCFAAPIADAGGMTVGAVSLSRRTARPLPDDVQSRLVDAVCEAGRRISECLGSGLLWGTPAAGTRPDGLGAE